MIFSVFRIVDSHNPTKTLWILSTLLSLNYQYFQHHSYCNNNEYYQYHYHYTIIINTEQRVAECATDSSQLSDWTRHKPPLLSRQNLNQPFIEKRVKSGPKLIMYRTHVFPQLSNIFLIFLVKTTSQTMILSSVNSCQTSNWSTIWISRYSMYETN